MDEALVLLLAAGVAGALLAILPEWRRLWRDAAGLPVNRFLSRRALQTEMRSDAPDEHDAEIRCALCGSRALCRSLLARGATSPAAGCPNARLFE